MEISIVGAGYVGLVTAVCFAELGHTVNVVERDMSKLERLNRGLSTIFEPGLDELLVKHISNARLNFFESLSMSEHRAQVIFLCVGTPPKEDGSADMTQIESAIHEIADSSIEQGYKLIVIKSTVPVGSVSYVNELLHQYSHSGLEIEVASNPEFLREGTAIKDVLHPDRIVLGVSTIKARSILEELYSPFDCPKVITSTSTAEIIKYASNSFLATKISFINMVSDLCDMLGADIVTVAEGMGLDDRIGPKFLKAGIGFGGSCFPKDLRAFVDAGKKRGLDFGLLEEVIRINNERPEKLLDKLNKLLGELKGKTVGILGLTFKPDTDDVRETPAAKLINELLASGAAINAFDPVGMENFKKMYEDLSSQINFVSDEYELSKNCHAVVVVTDWKKFTEIDWINLKGNMISPIVLDARNVLDASKMLKMGFVFNNLGGMTGSVLNVNGV